MRLVSSLIRIDFLFSMTFRGLLLWLHLILGLTGAIVIAIASATGAWIVVQVPLEQLLIPVPEASGVAVTAGVPAIIGSLEQQYAPRRVTSVALDSGRAIVATLNDRSRAFVDPANGSVIRFRQLNTISFENFSAVMRRLHVNLFLGQRGRLIVTVATAEALLLALTGLWLWWRKKHWKFTRWRGSVYRVSWDLHNASGLWFLVPALSMTITGLLLFVPGPVYRLAGDQPTPYRAAPANAVAVISASDTTYLNRSTAEVVELRPKREGNRADRALAAVEQLHTGELFGATGMTIMACGSAMLAVMTVTGVVLGWKRILILAHKRADD